MALFEWQQRMEQMKAILTGEILKTTARQLWEGSCYTHTSVSGTPPHPPPHHLTAFGESCQALVTITPVYPCTI